MIDLGAWSDKETIFLPIRLYVYTARETSPAGETKEIVYRIYTERLRKPFTEGHKTSNHIDPHRQGPDNRHAMGSPSVNLFLWGENP